MEQKIAIEQRTHAKAKVALLILAIAWFLSYYEIIFSLYDAYLLQPNNKYCLVAIALAVILAYSKRSELLVTNFKTSQLGLVSLFILTLMTTYFSLEKNVFLQQCSIIAMIPAMLLTIIGREATKILTLPILLTFFAIPFGNILNIYIPELFAKSLQNNWFEPSSGIILQNSTIIAKSDYISLKKVIDSILITPLVGVITLFIARFIFKEIWLQVCISILTITIPIILNYFFLGMYVSSTYLPKLISVYNLQFIARGLTFTGIALAFFVSMWIKIYFVTTNKSNSSPETLHSDFLELHWLRPVIIAYCIFFIVPWAGGVFQDLSEIRNKTAISLIPPTIDNWQGPLPIDPSNWYPHFPYSRASFVKSYQKDTLEVQFFTAYVGREMEENSLLHPANRLYSKQKWKMLETRYLKTNIKGHLGLNVKETLIEYAGRTKLIWHWYYIGTTAQARPYVVDALDSISYITRGYEHSGIIAVAIDYPGDLKFGRRNLTIFLNSLAPHLPKITNPTKKKLLDFTVR